MIAVGVRPVLAALIVLLPAGLVVAPSAGPQLPVPVFVDVPTDVQHLVGEVWEELPARVPAQVGCLDGVTVTADWSLGDRARYLPGDATIVLGVPATAPVLRAALVHELAHHLEFTCPTQPAMRGDVIHALGLPADAAWFGHGGTLPDGSAELWAGVPSERFAEAVVEIALGGRPTGPSPMVTDDLRDVVATWLGADGGIAS